MILAIGDGHDMSLKEVSSLEFAAHEMSKYAGHRARVFDIRHGNGALIHDVAVCSDQYAYNLKTLRAGLRA